MDKLNALFAYALASRPPYPKTEIPLWDVRLLSSKGEVVREIQGVYDYSTDRFNIPSKLLKHFEMRNSGYDWAIIKQVGYYNA